ncbi:DUF5365 family protein [Bacillus suaedaesalsae]|uniref:YhcU family protein n=1 Tax=Bacillus suaedaesalsae TaxID=2810349 RepID=A0ABS2DEZ9_9BACI|nr:DUF5365 family protein [Bacillus suaedaesalsae]MBM6617049.1 YhcU family protein [Bacillus suaedaesalsae]
MKIVTASTPEQENFIQELVNYMYTEVFPYYFSDSYIKELEELNVLKPTSDDLYNGTLKEAFQLISGMQALICVIESVRTEEVTDYHREIFDKNIMILKEYGYKFPFSIDHFSTLRQEPISSYLRPTSSYLM